MFRINDLVPNRSIDWPSGHNDTMELAAFAEGKGIDSCQSYSKRVLGASDCCQWAKKRVLDASDCCQWVKTRVLDASDSCQWVKKRVLDSSDCCQWLIS